MQNFITSLNNFILSPFRVSRPIRPRLHLRGSFFAGWRTRRQARRIETQQLYHFAELGQLSTLLLHELANHLSVLNLDVQALANRGRARALARTFETLTHLDRLVSEVREHLMHNQKSCDFNVAHRLEKIITRLQPFAERAGTYIQLEIDGDPSTMIIHGDPIRFHLLITILVKNACEALIPGKQQHPISVQVTSRGKKLAIVISDWGQGFKVNRQTVFEPFHSTKKTGMGIGLFITKTIVETHFQGRIELTHPSKPTIFSLTLPRK